MAEAAARQETTARPELVRGAMNRIAVMKDAARMGNEAALLLAADAFAEQLELALKRGDPVVLVVEEEHLRCEGADVLGNDLVSLSILEGLEQEGLRRVVIDPSASRGELARLGELLAENWRDKTSDDEDLEAAAWRLGFSHVHLEIGGRQVLTEADVDEVSPEEMVSRLVRQLGIEDLSTEVLEAEVGQLIDRLRRAPSALSPEAAAQKTALAERADHKVLSRQLHAVTRGADTTDDAVGRCFFEVVRGAVDATEAAESLRRILGHLQHHLELGRAGKATALLRRLLVLAAPDAVEGFAHKDVVRQSLSSLWSETGRAAILAGIRANPDTEAWKGALFTLGELATEADLPALTALGAAVDDAELRQPLADALLLTTDRTGANLKELLQKSDEAALPVVLLATRRRPDPTLVEPILARERSQDPRVREAVLLALREHQSPRIKEVMRAALQDPAKPVRMEALRYLSVYRDAESAGRIHSRLEDAARGRGPGDEDELRAMAIAYAIVTRGEGVKPLEDLVAESAKAPSSKVGLAALHGLRAAGRGGREALERLGRTHPELREEIRALLGGTR